MLRGVLLSILCGSLVNGALLVRTHPISMSAAEDAAKAAWLAKLDAPAFGGSVVPAAGPTASQAPESTAAAPNPTSEDAAKAAWLAKLDAPAWDSARPTTMPALATATHSDASAEDAAKRAWLAKIDAPSWGASDRMAQPATSAFLTETSAQAASAEAAKAAWLSKLEAPSWGAAATVPSGVADAAEHALSPEEAPASQLENLDLFESAEPQEAGIRNAASDSSSARPQPRQRLAKQLQRNHWTANGLPALLATSVGSQGSSPNSNWWR